jgi:hypothetical protein
MELSTFCKTSTTKAVLRPSTVDSGKLVFTNLPSKARDENGEVITAELRKQNCPKCSRIYANGALKFCRTDGAVLLIVES